MAGIAEIKAELSGNTNFDAEHEEELFERIAEIEAAGDAGLVPGLSRADHIWIAVMFIVFGIVPVIWNAVMYF